MAVLTAAAAMATVTIEVGKRPPIMTSLCVAVRDCDELFFEQLDRWYRSWAHKKMLDWSVCHQLTAPACIAGRRSNVRFSAAVESEADSLAATDPRAGQRGHSGRYYAKGNLHISFCTTTDTRRGRAHAAIGGVRSGWLSGLARGGRPRPDQSGSGRPERQ